jgi:hypothetical protein
MASAQQTLDLGAGTAAAPEEGLFPGVRERYLEAIKGGHWPWAQVHPRARFSEYDGFRAIWADELWQWLYGGNPRRVHCLTAFAWAVQHARMSGGGRSAVCLNWSDRNQRVYLGDGLLEYLGILKDEVKRVYGQPPAE